MQVDGKWPKHPQEEQDTLDRDLRIFQIQQDQAYEPENLWIRFTLAALASRITKNEEEAYFVDGRFTVSFLCLRRDSFRLTVEVRNLNFELSLTTKLVLFAENRMSDL